MRKIKALLLCVIMLGSMFAFTGCDGGFKEVQSISYVVGGKETTLKSIIEIIFLEEEELIDQNAYLQIPKTHRYESEIEGTLLRLTIARDKSNIDTIKKNDSMGIYGRDFRKRKVQSVENFYVKIKIIDNRTIEIRNHDNNLSRLAVNSYTIEYFN